MLTSLKAGDIFFIDEVHRLRPALEEFPVSAMEEFASTCASPTARTRRRSDAARALHADRRTTRFGLLTPRCARGSDRRAACTTSADALVQIIHAHRPGSSAWHGCGRRREIARRSRGTARRQPAAEAGARLCAVRAGGKYLGRRREALKRSTWTSSGSTTWTRDIKAIIEMFEAGRSACRPSPPRSAKIRGR